MKANRAVLLRLMLLSLFLMQPLDGFSAEGNLTPAGKLLVKDATSINLMEIQLGRVAREKGASPGVREYGDRLEREHGKAYEDLKAIAVQKNLKLPGQLERRHVQMLARLSEFKGVEFDRAFLQLMVKNHDRSIARFKKALRKVKDDDLKAWTSTMIPMLEQHLRRARELAQLAGVG